MLAVPTPRDTGIYSASGVFMVVYALVVNGIKEGKIWTPLVSYTTVFLIWHIEGRRRTHLCSSVCLSASVMHHKVCLSSLPHCINASSTTVQLFQRRRDSRCLTGLKQAVPPPFSGSACVGVQPLLNAGNCVKAQVVLLAVSFRYPFLWVSSPLDFGWERKSAFFIFFFVFHSGNLAS